MFAHRVVKWIIHSGALSLPPLLRALFRASAGPTVGVAMATISVSGESVGLQSQAF